MTSLQKENNKEFHNTGKRIRKAIQDLNKESSSKKKETPTPNRKPSLSTF